MNNANWLWQLVRGLGYISTAFLCNSNASAAERIPVLLSTDLGNEVDDQWPLVHLLASPRFQIVGIVGAHAPAEAIPTPAAHNATIAIRQIVEDRLGQLEHAPILEGANSKLLSPGAPQDSFGVRFMIEASRRYNARNRLNVLVVGAATDAASAILLDPSIASRIRIISMGFRSRTDGREFNIQNDPVAWKVILASDVPLVVGDAAVTSRDITLTRAEARVLLPGEGPLERWLLRDLETWYHYFTKTSDFAKRPDGTRAWPIWDSVTVAYLLGMTEQEVIARPSLDGSLTLVPGSRGRVTWITKIDGKAMFADFADNLRRYSSTHAVRDQPCYTIAREALACWRIDIQQREAAH